MSDDQTPQRPGGFGAGAPRVEVESTPQAPSGAESGPTPPAGMAEPTAQIPTVPPVGATASVPPVATETVKHTVVKTRTKKFPVFIASLAGLVVGAILVVALVMIGAFRVPGNSTASTGATTSQQTIDINSEDTTLAEAVSAKALPSVVSIRATTGESTSGDTSTASSSSGSIGSGVILDSNGNILTNYHVVSGATSLTVTLDSGETREAELVGSDQSSDLAVIKIKDTSGLTLTPISIGDSDNLKVGTWVMAIGSPFGNEQSVSTGIVSALYRSTALPSTTGTSIYANMIQTDAAINPGNSGGALVNSNGELIGINSVIESYSGSSSGVGFAIPINYAKNIADQIIAGQTPVHPYLGVTLTTPRTSSSSDATGAQVVSVEEGGPAAEAGIQQGDVITAVDGEAVTSADGLIIALREHAVGDKVTLTVNRDGKEQDVEVTLGSDEALQNSQQQDATENGSGSGMSREELLEYLQNLLGGQGSNQ
ncbi:S1C family serine protease [Collinsella vaginalis]|uniref:S1C family serine protease n=1 Tax=Collinsella vaginalis TaxID=1870987 RepID=UPI000A26AA16|nr:trypsin-like peptidase domain-containing protein [Collinsella vaginalis]